MSYILRIHKDENIHKASLKIFNNNQDSYSKVALLILKTRMTTFIKTKFQTSDL